MAGAAEGDGCGSAVALAAACAALLALGCAALAPSPATGSPAAPPSYHRALLLLEHPKGLYRANRRITDPTSPRYRDYRSVERLVDRFGAKRGKRKRALDWLRSHGYEAHVDRTETFITAEASRREARRALVPSDPETAPDAPAGTMVAAEVPPALAGAVDAIALDDGTPVASPAPRAEPQPAPPRQGEEAYSSALDRTGMPAGCDEGVRSGGFTPSQYLKAYGHSALHERGIRGQGQRIALVEIDGFRRADIETFGRCFGIRIPPISVTPVGRKDPLPPGIETTLDLEVISAAAPGVRRIDVYEGGSSESDIARTASAALGRPGLHPDVVSISLGTCEPELQGQLAFVRAMNNVFALSGAAGISTFVASGDTGSTACRYNDAEGLDTALPVESVSVPSSSPFVTAVGGTNLRLTERNAIQREIVWNDGPKLAAEGGLGAGGGGLSLLTDQRPFWQDGKEFRGVGASRVVPDVSALADPYPGYALFCGEEACGPGPGWTQIGGTSAATPLTAGGIALANQLAKRRGRAQLGFLNPFLYQVAHRQYARHFRDVTIGDTDTGEQIAGSPGPIGCCSASKGFDAASGFGSLEFERFAERAAK